jgi:hypothetical protein
MTRGSTQPFKLGLRFGNRGEALLRRFLNLNSVLASQDDLIVIPILVKECTFVMNRAGGDLHLDSMLFSVAFHLLEMFVIAVFSKPSDNILVRPVDLQGVRVFVINVVVDRHLVNVDALLDSEFWDQDVKGSVQNVDNLSGSNNRSVAVREVRDQDT